jgi:hypothetical protein
MSLAARLVNVLAAPGELFDDLRARRESIANWLVPAAIYMVVGWIGATLVLTPDWARQQMRDLQGAAIERQVEAGKVTREQATQIQATTEKYAMIGARISGYGGPLVLGVAGPFVWGAFFGWWGRRYSGEVFHS